ncbi:1-acyl-sn-glycerol-3-phosphate acyltransferase [Caenispirillum salinarum AK4]|uniref:1-acyl-sn-glycerol-3-phosphate acyltransferase n=1 Tax=Caenispirillum salinarum AK4 TaxID=1238182 RepID=K9HFP6_9PROT|nr:lysophospholipid acyltransferase family protein [Caenispirillum salinarum]EKV29253.1 1-acyl-sn-glycerol-3-phosphate acyltransferase [Caenispirillum salinarum AK4]
MTFLRSLLFNVAWLSWTVVCCLMFIPLLVLPKGAMKAAARLWTRGILTLARWMVGLRYEIRGLENLPADGRCIVAAKHQSAWDTFFFHGVLADPVYILKKELLHIPFVGWYMARTQQIGIDRSTGAKALKFMVKAANQAAEEQRQLVIFPEGTRTPPGDSRPYKPGITALYGRLDLPVVPVALNSGLFWARQSFIKYPGTIVVEFLEPIPPGQDKRVFMKTLHERIEDACARLNREAGFTATGADASGMPAE